MHRRKVLSIFILTIVIFTGAEKGKNLALFVEQLVKFNSVYFSKANLLRLRLFALSCYYS